MAWKYSLALNCKITFFATTNDSSQLVQEAFTILHLVSKDPLAETVVWSEIGLPTAFVPHSLGNLTVDVVSKKNVFRLYFVLREQVHIVRL